MANISTIAIDMSGSPVSVSVLPISTIATPHLRFACLKTAFFNASGFQYTVEKNTNIVTTAITASGRNNIQSSHIISQANQTLTSWFAATSFVLNYNFMNVAQSAGVNLLTASSLIGASSNLGRHIMYLVTHAITVTSPVSQFDVFSSTTVSSLSASIESQIGNLIASSLATQANQQLLLDRIIALNGPVLSEQATLFTSTSSISDMDILLQISNVRFFVSFGSSTRELNLTTLPVCIRLQ